MTVCETCELHNNPCPGVERGAFCTKITGTEDMGRHPAAVDFQGPASCEITDLYERPALEEARRGSTSE
jgi:hypothetical protein